MVSEAVPVQAGGVVDGRPAEAGPRGVGTTTVAVCGVLLTVFNAVFLTCGCGHYSLVALPIAMIALVLVWLPFTWPGEVSFLRRVVIAAAVVVATFGFVTVVLSLLWHGHDALFAYNQHLAAAAGRVMVRASQVSLGVLAGVVLMRETLRLVVRGLRWMNGGHDVRGA